MTCEKVIKYIEDWAPKEIAWDQDNVGLQIGSTKRRIKNLMLSLDLNDKVVDQAIKQKCNFIITHHPLFFHSIKKINTDSDKTSKLIEKILKNDITLYSAHTNLDFTKDGVSFSLARKLKLQNINFLASVSENQIKLVVFVPESSIEKLANAIHRAGGGIIGEYSNCSFRTKGTGTFKGSEATNPVIGSRNKLEFVNEVKLEVIVNSWKMPAVITAIKTTHPYEEVAYDIYPLKNDNVNYGMGAIGDLKVPMNKREFLNHIITNLKIKNLRYSNGKDRSIKKVAVCGGSCSELLNQAITIGADAFITADVKYHAFQEALGEILFVDAGHYETEIHSIDEIEKRLNNFLVDHRKIKVYKYKGSTNPVIFYNN